MKVKLFLIFIFLLVFSQSVYSSGALRHILPYLSSITGTLKVGEIAYDDENGKLVVKTNDGIESMVTTVYDKESFPLISTNSYKNTSFTNVKYSEISAGKIYLKGRVYSNSAPINCLHDDNAPTTGFGNYDGSTVPSTEPPSGHPNPMYLYLIQDGSGFKCAFSFNSNGPNSTFVGLRPWILAQTIVGATGFSASASLKTIGNRTHTRNAMFGMLQLVVDSGTNLEIDNPALLTPSMKSIGISNIYCSGSDAISINEKVILPFFTKSKNKRNRATSVYVKAGGCDGFTSPNGDAFEYIFTSNERKIYTTSTTFSLISILGWTEKQLTSI